MKFKDKLELKKYADDYRARYDGVVIKNDQERDAYETATRDRTYANLAEGFRLVSAMYDPANADVVAAFLESRDLVAATGKTNPFYPLVQSLYGKWNDEGDWKHFTSAIKYANVFRLAHQLGKKPEKFAQWLRDFLDEPTSKRGISGAVAQDQRTNGRNDPAKEEELQRQIGVVLSAPPAATIDVTGLEINKARFVCLWGTLDNGQFKVMGELPDMTGSVERHLRKVAPNKAPVIEEARKLMAKAPAKPAEGQRDAEAKETADAIAA